MKPATLFAQPVLFGVVLLAQAPQPVAQDPAKARLEGQVLNAVGKEPLKKARLTLRMNVAAMQTQRQQQPAATSTYTVTSDAMGKFEFPNVEPGDYQMTVRLTAASSTPATHRYRARLCRKWLRERNCAILTSIFERSATPQFGGRSRLRRMRPT